MNPTKIREINAHLKALMDELYEYIHDSCAQVKPLDGVTNKDSVFLNANMLSLLSELLLNLHE